MSRLNFDPLTADYGNVWRYQRGKADQRSYNAPDDDCDCGASVTERHREDCSVSPIYARTIKDLGSVRECSDDFPVYTGPLQDTIEAMRRYLQS